MCSKYNKYDKNAVFITCICGNIKNWKTYDYKCVPVDRVSQESTIKMVNNLFQQESNRTPLIYYYLDLHSP